MDRGKAAFEHDGLLQAWFLRQLQIIGEAARALQETVRLAAPDVPCPKIMGMRNVLAHGYFEIDAEIVWNAATHDIPALKLAVERLLKVLEGPSAP